jgi:hypothetical protein
MIGSIRRFFMKIRDIVSGVGKARALLLLLGFHPFTSFALPADVSAVDKNIQSMESRLDNDRDKLDFETRAAATSLVKSGDPCIDQVLSFATRKGHESRRRTIGLDILFRVNSDNARATIVKLFSDNYVVLTNALPAVERLNSPNVVFEGSASVEYNGFMFAYHIAREAIRRDGILARQVIELVPENDALCVGVRDAYRILHDSGEILPKQLSLRVDAGYVVSLLPFLPQISNRIARDEKLLKEFRKWYCGILDSDILDLDGFAGMLNAIELADGAYLYEGDQISIVSTRHERVGRKNVSDLLRARKMRFDRRSKRGVE